MASQGTQNFPFSITYSNRFYNIVQLANNNLVIDIPHDQFEIVAHPSQAEWVYFVDQAFDRTLCSNIVSTSRQDFINQVVALAAAGSSANVSIVSSIPLTVSNMGVRGEIFGFNDASALTILGNARGFRINPAAVGVARIYIRQVTAASSGLTSFATVAIDQGQTITGGTWTTIAGTNLQSNSLAGATVGAATSRRWVGDFRNTLSWDLAANADLSIPIGTNFVVLFSNGGVGSGAYSIIWIESAV